MNTDLEAFLLESNKIEGISGVRAIEFIAAQKFLALDEIKIADLIEYVQVAQPDAVLRDRPGIDVVVGNYVPPHGGQYIPMKLDYILYEANEVRRSARGASAVHVAYEALHPFSDGNGRSGRMLWLWMMEKYARGAPLGFLHHFYYQTLDAAEGRR